MTLHRVLAWMFFAALFVAIPTPAVYAGGMGVGNASAYECYMASGDSPAGTIELVDFATRTVTLGAVRFVCTPVIGQNRIGPKADSAPADCTAENPTNCADHLKCYDIRTQGASSTANLTLSDFFISATPVTISRPQLLCVGAQAQ